MTRYRIDPAQSRIWVDARSSLHGIHSETTGVRGWFEAKLEGDRLDAATPPAGRVELAVEALSSGNPLYDREMRRRIDARRYPTIVGELTEMKDTPAEGRYLTGGEVTFRGVTRPASDEMTVSVRPDGAVLLEGSHTFDVRDFGMDPPKILTLRVFPEVDIKVSFVARPEGANYA